MMSLRSLIAQYVLKIAGGTGIGNVIPYASTLNDTLYANATTDTGDITVTDKYNHTIRLPASDHSGIGSSLYRSSTYESLTTSICENSISPGMTVVDIGANIGYYTLLFAKLVTDSGVVHAIEPDPTNFDYLESNITDARYSNIICHQLALADTSGTTELYLDPENHGKHSIQRATETAVTVTTSRFDSIIDRSVDFVKIDVEGAEPQVLDGMEKTLEQDRPTLILESIPTLWDVSLKSVYEPFWNRDYQVILLDETTNSRLSIDRGDLSSLREHSGNVLLQPNE